MSSSHRKEDGYYDTEEYRRQAEDSDPAEAYRYLQDLKPSVPKKTQRSIAKKSRPKPGDNCK